MGSNFRGAFQEILLFLKKNNITYVLIGAWSSSFWGQPRATEDIDFLILLEEKEFKKFKKKLSDSAAFKIDRVWEKTNPLIRREHIRILFKDIHLDIALPKDTHDIEVLQRRVLKKMGSLKMYIATPEDIVLMKIKSGRAKDFPDALSVFIKQQNNMDYDYLRLWAKKLHVYEELNWLVTKAEKEI